MPKQTKKGAIPKNQLEVLKGWQQIAANLHAVVQRRASDGMPVRKRGRYVETTPRRIERLAREGIRRTCTRCN